MTTEREELMQLIEVLREEAADIQRDGRHSAWVLSHAAVDAADRLERLLLVVSGDD